MKKVSAFTILILLALVIAPLSAVSEEKQPGPPPVTHTKDFERMKELVGVWEGKADMGKGMETSKISYELTSAGNAILERSGVGKPNEMVTVYHDYNGKLTLTHYCSLGNQPHLEVVKSGEGWMEFVLSAKNPGLSSLNETHMHAVKVSFDGKDNMTQTWTLYEKGVAKADHTIKFVRVKS
jgi:hypothetical protein